MKNNQLELALLITEQYEAGKLEAAKNPDRHVGAVIQRRRNDMSLALQISQQYEAGRIASLTE